MKNKRVLGILGIVAASVLVLSVLAYTEVIQVGPTLSCLIIPGSSRTFTIVANLEGFNRSKTLAPNAGYGVWPVMNVSKCDHVTIRVANTDSQNHSIAVSDLAADPLTVPAGQTLSISFLAYKTGHFRVSCTLTLCTVHDFMMNGQLNVA